MKTKALCSLLTLCSCCMAQKDGQHSLAGIKTVYVMVDSAVSDPGVPGLTSKVIKSDVEAQLRSFGIAVGPSPIVFKVSYFGAPGVLFGVSVDVVQRVALLRDPSIQVLLKTWKTDYTETTGVATNWAALKWTAQTIRDSTEKLVNEFLTAWLIENPDVKLSPQHEVK
jgi:hypothetical protein